MVGHCLEVVDHATIIGGDSVKAIDGVDFFCLTLTNILIDRIENVVSAVVHAHEKEFDAVGNVVDEICYMIKLKFTEILCFAYQRRVDNEEERKCKDFMWLAVQDKAEGYVQNTDENKDNDVYNSELKFTLAFVPDPEKDDLLVYLLDKDGNAIKDNNGEPIVRRLAGPNSEGRTADSIQPDKNGVYTLSGLRLSENSDFCFDLHGAV